LRGLILFFLQRGVAPDPKRPGGNEEKDRKKEGGLNLKEKEEKIGGGKSRQRQKALAPGRGKGGDKAFNSLHYVKN